MGKVLIIAGSIIVCFAIFWCFDLILDRFGWYDSFQITLILSKMFLVGTAGIVIAVIGIVKHVRNGE
jgi:hypothetical protein